MKSPIKIETYEQYCRLVEQYNRKGRLTNDYLQNGVEDIIKCGRLSAVAGQDNLFILVQKEGFYRLYYYINNIDETLSLPQGEFVSEILFRSIQGEPRDQVLFLENCGFKQHIRRDLLFAKYSDLTPPVEQSDIYIGAAQSLDDVKWAAELFNSTFDKWSGDFISPAEYTEMLNDGAVLLAKDLQGTLLGAFESSVEKGINWLRHFAVANAARGRGVGKALFDAVIEKGHIDDNTRYMLWVQHQNKVALNLYEKKGFSSMGKSTLSMIKI